MVYSIYDNRGSVLKNIVGKEDKILFKEKSFTNLLQKNCFRLERNV